MASSTTGSDQYEVLGNFSIDENGEYRNDLSQRRFLVEPADDQPNFDIHQGFKEFIGRDAVVVQTISIGPILDWIRDHQDELVEKKILKSEGAVKKLAVDFVGRRGFFSRLLRACESLEPLDILVTLCNGTYYIENIKDSGEETMGRKEMGYGGKKFVHCVTSPDGNAPDINEAVNANTEYVAVMKTQRGNHKIILSSEVQAERKDSNQSPPGNYVCIKTKKADLAGKPLTNFNRYKTLQWWSQNQIAGIPEVVFGMRDDSRHLITTVNTLKVDQLPGKAEGFWDPKLCQRKFESYLSEIKAMVREDNPRTVYHLQLPEVSRGRGIKDKLRTRCFKLIRSKKEAFLPDRYIQDVLDLKGDESTQ